MSETVKVVRTAIQSKAKKSNWSNMPSNTILQTFAIIQMMTKAEDFLIEQATPE